MKLYQGSNATLTGNIIGKDVIKNSIKKNSTLHNLESLHFILKGNLLNRKKTLHFTL